MGNRASKAEPASQPLLDPIKTLQNRIQQLESQISNITTTIANQYNHLSDTVDIISKQVQSLQQQIDDINTSHCASADFIDITQLRKENEALRAINAQLELKLRSPRELPFNQPITSWNLSSERVDEFVERLLQDPNISIKYLPDFVERQIYRNVFMVFMGLLQSIVDSSALEVIGHQLKFSLEPKADKIENLDIISTNLGLT